MALYFFNTQTTRRYSDLVGVELATEAEARREAIRCAGELMRDEPECFWTTRPWLVTITDAAGVVLYEIGMHGHATPVASSA